MAFLDNTGLAHVLGHIKTKFDEVESSIVQPDWNVNDESDPAYIRNRPFYAVGPTVTVLADNATLVDLEDMGGVYANYWGGAFDFVLNLGSTYSVNFNGVDYVCKCLDMGGVAYIGNISLFGGPDDTGETFCFYQVYIDGEHINMAATSVAEPWVYSVTQSYEYIRKIDGKFIDFPRQVGRVGGADYAEVFNSDNNIATGTYSHAEGVHTKVSGYASHVEGIATIAASDYQHVHGKYNAEDASGKYVTIVGNGSGVDVNQRSNAHTLDWSGNAWYAGTLKLGGTSYADASEVALKSEIQAITTAKIDEICV